VAEDQLGWFWIATADHVLRAERNKIASGTLGPSDLREYGAADGLRSTEGVKRSRSVISDPSGRIWFSLSRGLSVVDPSRVTDTSAPAIPQIQGLSADGSRINLQDPAHIPPSPKRITFTYTGLSLAVPEQVRFRYFLENFDRGWSEPVTAREAVYTNLGAGSYRFRVVASNSEQQWNGSEAAVRFVIEPLFWETWWFRATCFALVLLLVWCAHRYRLYQLTRQFNMRFEERVSERTRIARDLHDTLLQSFHGLLLRFQAVSNLLPARPQEAKERLEDAIDQAAQAVTEGRDAVQGLRASAMAPNDLAQALSALGEELGSGGMSQHSPEFRVEVEGAPRELQAILRDEVYRIAGEALRNAFRHAQARKIELEIHYDERQLRLRIRDDGKGMEARVLDGAGRPGHWGLRGMRERAKAIGGNLELWSNLESGTEIELTIPASIAYAASIPRRRSWFSAKRAATHD
jgi:signal transduction histidine kinase